MDLARAVRGQHHDGRLRRANGAQLGDADLEIGQQLEQEGLELGIRAIELVDQQDGRHRILVRNGLQERALDQEIGAEDVAQAFLLGSAARLQQPDLQHLARIVPFVDGRADVEPLIALQANQARAERLGQHLGHLRLACAGLTFQEQRLAQAQC